MKPADVGSSHLDRRQGVMASLQQRAAVRWLTVVVVIAIGGAGSGCAGVKKRTEPNKKAVAERNRKKEPRLIGIVKLVNTEGAFVLIDCGTNPAPDSEGSLKCRTGEVESAELRVSEIKRHPFVIADVIKGTPIKGDLVFQ